MKNFTLSEILIGTIIASGLIYMRFATKTDTSAAARAVVESYCVQAPSYEQNSDYIQALIERYHEGTFEEHFSFGTRRTASTFDEQMYFFYVFTGMGEQAQRDGKREVSEDLSDIWIRLQLDQLRMEVQS